MSQVQLNYPHRRAGHCGSGAFRDLLEWAGLRWGPDPLDEGMAFGLGGDLGFSYMRIPVGFTPPIYLVGRGPDLETLICDRLGIAHTIAATDDPDRGWALVRDQLDASQPVLCWADIGELPYLDVRMRMSRHDIVVTGYDDVTATATVVDNDRDQPQTVDYTALARARSSTAFPQPTRHTTFALHFPTALPDLHTTAADACRAASHAMRHPRPALPLHVGGDEIPASTTGLDGVTGFVDDLDRWGTAFDTDQLELALRSLAVFIDKAGTGGGLFRRLQAGYLTELAALTTGEPAAAARSAARAYTDLAERWSAVAGAAAHPGVPAARLDQVRDLAAALPQQERHSVDTLDPLADTLNTHHG